MILRVSCLLYIQKVCILFLQTYEHLLLLAFLYVTGDIFFIYVKGDTFTPILIKVQRIVK